MISVGTTGRERRAKRIELIVAWISVLTFAVGGEYAVHSLGHHFGWDDRIFFAAVAGFWWFYAMAVATWIVIIFRRVQAKSQSGETAGEVPQPAVAPMGHVTGALVLTGTHLMVFWCVISIAWRAHDRMTAGVSAGIMLALVAWSFFQPRGLSGTMAGSAYIGQLALCCAVMLAIFNLRFDVWLAGGYGVSVSEMHNRLPIWIVHLLTLFLVLWIAVSLALTKPKSLKL